MKQFTYNIFANNILQKKFNNEKKSKFPSLDIQLYLHIFGMVRT